MQYWRELGLPAFSMTLLHTKCLIMPYGFPVKFLPKTGQGVFFEQSCLNVCHRIKYLEDFVKEVHGCNNERRHRAVPEQVVLECVERFAERSLVHDDIEWRHVSLFPTFKKRFYLFGKKRVSYVPMLIDLTRCHRVESSEEARFVMMNYIKNHLVLIDGGNSSGGRDEE